MILKEPIFCRKPVYEVKAGLKEPVKVALTGDWHVSYIVSKKQRKLMAEKLREIRPDVIILQGDLFDTPKSFLDSTLTAELKKTLELCAKIAPTVMVLGNHDQLLARHGSPKTHSDFLSRVWPGAVSEWRKICRETGVKLLVDDWFEIKGLRIFGFYQDAETYYLAPGATVRTEDFKRMKRAVKELASEDMLKPKEGKAHWFAAHAPIGELYRMKELRSFDVFSFGHTHGGCVPIGLDVLEDLCGGHWGLIAPFKRLFPARFMRGREIVNGKASYIVNTGMVMTQECAPKPLQYLNFLKAAEVTEVVVR